MKDVTILIPQERISKKPIKSAKGDFEILGVKMGEKFLRLTMPKGYTLPDGDVTGNLYPRKYETPKGKFDELAIWVTNAVPSAEDVANAEADTF